MVLEGFLDWSDEKGLPFRAWYDVLEEKGIPGWLPLALFAVGAGVVAFLVLSPSTSTGSVVVFAKTADGQNLENVNVSVFGSGNFEKSGVTGPDGSVRFKDVPSGPVQVLASSPEVTFASSSADLTLGPNKEQSHTFYSDLIDSQSVVLQVDVVGAPFADITLYDDAGSEIDFAKEVAAETFFVQPDRSYRIKAESEGFLPSEKTVQVAGFNVREELILQRIGQDSAATLHIGVFADAVEENPLANATVSVTSAGVTLARGKTADDGTLTPVTLPLGSEVFVTAEKAGFAEKTAAFNVTDLDSRVTLHLNTSVVRKDGFKILVRDVSGNPVFSPIIRVLRANQLVEEALPLDGLAFFEISPSGHSASIYKPGYLPVFLPKLSRENDVVLNASDANRSGSVVVFVTDFLGRDVQGATVELFAQNGNPLGFPPRFSTTDGSARFEDVPLVRTRAKASYQGRFVQSDFSLVESHPKNEFNATVFELSFQAASVPFMASVVDHFSKRPVAGAQVTLGSSSCTTRKDGTCVQSVPETESASVSVDAQGYEDFESAPFLLSPFNADRAFELFPTSVAKDIQLSFVGVFDVSGNRVDSLGPLSEYEARYLFRAPNVSFSKAEAFLEIQGASVLGGQSSSARVTKGGTSDEGVLETIQITPEGFFPGSFEASVGSSVPFENVDNRTHVVTFDSGQTLTLKSGESKNVVFNVQGSFGFRSLADPSFTGFSTLTPRTESPEDARNILFEFAPFSQSRELSVRFKTGRDDVALSHRTAFFTESETLRAPKDGVSLSGKFRLRFSGECNENVCVELFFERQKTKAKRLDLPLNEKADLVVRIAGLDRPGVVLLTPSEALGVESGKNDAFTAAVSNNEAVLRVPAKLSESRFTLVGKRLSDDASVHVSVLDQNASVFEADASLRVFSRTKPALVVKVKPLKIPAFDASRIVFSVTDSLFNEPITEARVSVGGQEALMEKPGQYAADLAPDSLKPVPFDVSVTGFRSFKGSVAVEAPEDWVDIEPKTLALSVDSVEQTVSPVSVSNRLSDTVTVSFSLDFDKKPSLADVSLGQTTLSLKGKQASSVDFAAKLKTDLLLLAKTAQAESEDVRGRILIKTRTGSLVSEHEVPFIVTASAQKQGFDDAWELSTDSLSFQLEPPRKKEQTLELAVTNNADRPLIFNFEQTLGLSVQPASLVVPPNAQGSVFVKGKSSELDCFSEDLKRSGTLSVQASFQGLTSKKRVQVDLEASAQNLLCVPKPGSQIVLPVDTRLPLLGARSKTNPDGSVSLKMPNQELLWIGGGASVSQNEASLPQGIPVVLESYRVRPFSEGWTVTFPTPLILSLPQEADKETLPTGQVQVTLQNAQIILPQGAQVSLPQSGSIRPASSEAVVPAQLPVILKRLPYNYDAARNTLPPGAVEIALPVDALLDLPVGTIERNPPKYSSALPSITAKDNLQNLKAVQLPGGERLAFGQDAGIALAEKTVRLPAGTSLYVSKTRVRAIDGLDLSQGFELTLPIPYVLQYGLESKVTKLQSGLWGLKVADEASVEATFKLSPVKKSLGFELRVPRDSGLIYRKGAYARNPVDPSSVASCRLSYAAGEELSFTLPQGTTLEKAEGGYVATLPKCDASSRIKFSASNDFGTPDVLETPAIRQLFFPTGAEFIAGDPQTQEEKSVRVNGKIQYVACLKDADGKDVPESLRYLTLVFPDPTFVALPPRAFSGKVSEQSEIDLGKPAAVRFQSKNGNAQELGSTSKIFLDKNSGNIAAAGAPEYPAEGLAFTDGAGLHFVPSCEKAPAKLSVSSTADDVEILEKDSNSKVLKVTFTNAGQKFKEEKRVCIYNRGKSLVLVDGVNAEGLDPEGDKQAVARQIMGAGADGSIPAETAYFDQSEKFNKQRLRLDVEAKSDAAPCHTFVLTLALPPDLLLNEQCIRSEWDGKTLKGKYRFPLKDANGDSVAASPKHDVGVEMTFDAKSADCSLLRDRQIAEDLLALSVNYDEEELDKVNDAFNLPGVAVRRLAFKAPGHERFFGVTNNEEQDVTLVSIKGTGSSLVDCRRMDGTGANVQLTGAKITPGGVLLVSCTSKTKGAGTLDLEFSGSKGLRAAKHVALEVFQPEPGVAPLYAFTPIGRTLPFLAQQLEAKKVAVTKQVTTAPASSLSFAEKTESGTQTDDASNGGVEVKPKPKTPQEIEADRKAALAATANLDNFRLCKTYFCTYGQANGAMDSFLRSYRDVVEARLSDAGGDPSIATLQKFCASVSGQGGQAVMKKSLYLQLAQVPLSVDYAQELSRQTEDWKHKLFDEYGDLKLSTKGSEATPLSGCGIYQVQIVMNPACFTSGPAYQSVSDWKKAMSFELRVQKLAACPENLANAPLFLANEPNAYTGNKMAKGSGLARTGNAFRDAFTNWGTIGSALSALSRKPDDVPAAKYYLETLGRLRVGVLGQYGYEPNDRDSQTVQALYSSMYGVDLSKVKPPLCRDTGAPLNQKPCLSTPYDDAGFCWNSARPVITQLGVASGVYLAVSTLTAAAQGPVGLGFGLKAALTNYRVISSVSACLATGVSTKVTTGQYFNTCQTLEGCTSGVLANLMDALFPIPGTFKLLPQEITTLSAANAFSLAFSSVGAIAVQSAIGAAPTYALEALGQPPSQVVPTYPFVYVVRGVASPANIQGAAGGVRNVFLKVPIGMDQARTVAQVERDLAKQGVPRSQARNAARTLFKLSDRGLLGLQGSHVIQALTKLDASEAVRVQKSFQPAKELARQVVAKDAAAARTAFLPNLPEATPKEELTKALAELFSDDAATNLRKAPGFTSGGKIKSAAGLFTLRTAQGASITPSLSGKVGDAFPTSSTVTAESRTGAFRLLKASRAAKGIFGVFTSLLFSTDFRPVQAQLSPNTNSHIVAFHVEDQGGEKVPSTTALCLSDDPSECKDAANRLSAADFCSSSTCIKWYKMTGKTVASYVLVAGFSSDASRNSGLLPSIFNPEEKPVLPQPALLDAQVDYEFVKPGTSPTLQASPVDAVEKNVALVAFYKQRIAELGGSLKPDTQKALDEAEKLYREGRTAAAEINMEKIRQELQKLTERVGNP